MNADFAVRRRVVAFISEITNSATSNLFYILWCMSSVEMHFRTHTQTHLYTHVYAGHSCVSAIEAKNRQITMRQQKCILNMTINNETDK